MKKIILLLLISIVYNLSITTSFSQVRDEDLVINSLNDFQVKTKTQRVHQYINRLNKFEEIGYRVFKWYYNDEGKLIEFRKYNQGGNPEILSKIKFLYNDDLLVEEKMYDYKNDLTETTKYIYDNNLNLMEKIYIVTEKEKDMSNWNYFRINVNTNDDSIFVWAQEDMGIEPFLENYTVVINVSQDNEQDYYLALGDESDAYTFKFAWSQLTEKVQQGLLNWSGLNKLNMNTHGLSKVNFKYDNYNRVIEKAEYNYSGDTSYSYKYYYNKKGQLDKKEVMFEGKVINSYSFEYSNSKLVKELSTSYWGDSPNIETIIYSYDGRDRLIEKSLLGKSIFYYKNVYKYNNEGCISSEELWYSRTKPESKVTYKYKYY